MSAPQASAAKVRCTWQPPMEEALLDTLLDAQTQGLQTDNGGFKTTGWNLALEAVKACTIQTVTVQQIKSKYDAFKQDWKAWKAFIDHTGLGWDSEKGVPTGPPEVLEAFFQACPRARKFRDKPIPYESKLRTLLDGAIAVGANAIPISNVLQQISVNSDNSEEPEMQNENPNNDSDQGETDEYSWPSSPPPSATPGPISTPATTNTTQVTATQGTATQGTATQGTTTQDSNLGRRKRKSKNAAAADLRKRRKTSGHALADVMGLSVDEWKNTNKLYADQLKQQNSIARRQFERKEKEDVISRVVDVLTSEFEDLSVVEEDFINSVLENKSVAVLFLARTPERRRIWVEQILAQRHEG
jgi:Myb/SANT-like DNA-binding domain